MSLQSDERSLPGPPLIGALLRIPWEEVHRRLLDGLHAAGFTDLHAAHLSVLLYPGPDGLRPSDLAAQRQTSRQAMNYLLGQVEELGYIERRADPADQRARRIALTPRGRKAGQVMRDTTDELEREWSRALGQARFDELKASLAELAALVERDGRVPRG
ncbi:MAG TPA: MarR family transcriptional regulator [Solirubrobacteraceae bacterium]|nr:MarR family transcriptional regulator [Solirubrobacteraceae bacterium]